MRWSVMWQHLCFASVTYGDYHVRYVKLFIYFSYIRIRDAYISFLKNFSSLVYLYMNTNRSLDYFNTCNL